MPDELKKTPRFFKLDMLAAGLIRCRIRKPASLNEGGQEVVHHDTAPFQLEHGQQQPRTHRQHVRLGGIRERRGEKAVEVVEYKVPLLDKGKTTAGQDITCNAVCPGTTRTPVHEASLNEAMARDGTTEADAERTLLAGKQPTGRLIAPGNVAALILFLCGPEAADITGAVLPIDGGWSST